MYVRSNSQVLRAASFFSKATSEIWDIILTRVLLSAFFRTSSI